MELASSLHGVISTRPFELDKDFKDLLYIAQTRKLPAPKPELLPAKGVTVCIDEEVVGFAFLYQTDSKLCFMENLIVQAGLPSEVTEDLIKDLTGAIISLAKDLGFELILTNPVTSMRVQKIFENFNFLRILEGGVMFGKEI